MLDMSIKCVRGVHELWRGVNVGVHQSSRRNTKYFCSHDSYDDGIFLPDLNIYRDALYLCSMISSNILVMMLTWPPLQALRIKIPPPVMHVLVAQDLNDFLITQRRLPLTHLARYRRVWRGFLEKLCRRHRRRNRTICRVEDLETQPIFLARQIADLPQVPCIDVAPGVPLAGLRLPDVPRKVPRVLVRLDHVADAQRVDVDAEAARKGARDALAAELAERVAVHRVVVVGVLVEREGVVVAGSVGALAEADAVGRLAGRDDDLLDAQFAGGFDHVVG